MGFMIVAGDTGDRPSAYETEILSRVTALLLSAGQTTEQIVKTARRLGGLFGVAVVVVPGWDGTILHVGDGAGTRSILVATRPDAVDMRRTAATMHLVDALCRGETGMGSASHALDAIAALPPVPVARFAIMAGAGAASLATIFGVSGPLDLVVIFAIACAGGVLRRRLAGLTRNLFVQPFAAAALAGLVGAALLRLQGGALSSLVALCPCMVLVPGPHLLNGALDLVRGRLPIGAARCLYAALIIVAICGGLLLGLAAGGAHIPDSSAAVPVGLLRDALPAGIAVLAYGSFFDMPWRTLPVPVLIGMAAHALHWAAVGPGHASPATGAFAASLFVGVLTTPIADRLHLPFAGCAFAAVVALLPGVLLFRMAGELVALVAGGTAAPQDLVSDAATNGAGALMVIAALAAGLVIPKLLLERLSAP